MVAVMMKANYLRLAEVARIAKQFEAPLRVNVLSGSAVRYLCASPTNSTGKGSEDCLPKQMRLPLASCWFERWRVSPHFGAGAA